jgi:citrate synthase
MASGYPGPAPGAGKVFLSSGEVVDRLGISKSTLYAYVSRGLIRSEPDPGSPRSRRYRAEDVERLLNRQRMRSDPEKVTTTALAWGSPILDSSISVITDGRLNYRDHDAIDLARQHAFEDVAALLWRNDLTARLPHPSQHSASTRQELVQQTTAVARSLDVPARVQMLLPILEQREQASYDFRPETTQRIGVDILQTFIGALVGAEGQSGIARTLQAYWTPGEPEMAHLIDAALILAADHELNISTFTVRCIASARAPLHSAIAGGLAALRGGKHGGATLQAEALVNEVATPERAYDTLRNRLQRGEMLAGFGHRLYPAGDPRGAALLDLVRQTQPNSQEVTLAEAICDAAQELQGVRPNLDFALVVLARLLEQPAGTALALMALGRTAGWIAHAQEEYTRNQLIRPRARYTGTADAREL